MKSVLVGLILSFIYLYPINLIASQPKFQFFEWGAGLQASKFGAMDDAIPLENWNVETANTWEKIKIPFFTIDAAAINLKTTFTVDSSLYKKELFLIPMSLSGSAQFFLNQKLIQFYPNSDVPVKIKLPKDLLNLSKSNELEIRLKIPENVEEGFPNYVHLFTEPEYLGITKPICICTKPEISLDNFKYQFKNIDDLANIDYSFDLVLDDQYIGLPDRLSLDYSIINEIGRLYHRRVRTIRKKQTSISDELKLPLTQLWSAEQPKNVFFAYTLSIGTKIVKQDTISIGFRSFKNENGKFLINGIQTKIKGINYYQNYLMLGNQKYYQKLRFDLSRIKELGFNSIRYRYAIPDEFFMHIADSIGLMLFAEIPIRRYPIPLFLSDNLLENVKNSIINLGKISNNYPSLVALGIGQEIPLVQSAVQKFILIIKGFASTNLNMLIYSSPLPNQGGSSAAITDFYILDIYQPLQNIENNKIPNFNSYTLAGNAGIIKNDKVFIWDNEPSNMQRAVFLKREIQTMFDLFQFEGGFIESYQDWFAKYPTNVTVKEFDSRIMPNGLFNINGEAKPWLSSIENIWGLSEEATLSQQSGKKKTNFFTILMVFATILFFAIYRKRPRLNDNLKRAIRHPYGFFVDMRERRIIPLFNSIIVGAFASLILASYLGSFFYYYLDSFWMQEIWSVFLIPTKLFDYYLFLSSSPVTITVLFFILLFLYPFVVSIILFIVSIISGEKIRFRQGVAIGLWSGVPLFFLLPISIFGFHLLYYLDNKSFLFIILGLFIIWAHFRIINGIRVLFITKAMKVFIIMLLSYVIPFLIFWAVFRPEPYWYDYFSLLLNAKNLF